MLRVQFEGIPGQTELDLPHPRNADEWRLADLGLVIQRVSDHLIIPLGHGKLGVNIITEPTVRASFTLRGKDCAAYFEIDRFAPGVTDQQIIDMARTVIADGPVLKRTT
jgi:hypothetical protein